VTNRYNTEIFHNGRLIIVSTLKDDKLTCSFVATRDRSA